MQDFTWHATNSSKILVIYLNNKFMSIFSAISVIFFCTLCFFFYLPHPTWIPLCTSLLSIHIHIYYRFYFLSVPSRFSFYISSLFISLVFISLFLCFVPRRFRSALALFGWIWFHAGFVIRDDAWEAKYIAWLLRCVNDLNVAAAVAVASAVRRSMSVCIFIPWV